MERDKRKKGENEKKKYSTHRVNARVHASRVEFKKKKYFFFLILSPAAAVKSCSYKAVLSFRNTDYPCEM